MKTMAQIVVIAIAIITITSTATINPPTAVAYKTLPPDFSSEFCSVTKEEGGDDRDANSFCIEVS